MVRLWRGSVGTVIGFCKYDMHVYWSGSFVWALEHRLLRRLS